MSPSRRTHACPLASIKRLSGDLTKMGLRLRRQTTPAPIGSVIIDSAASLLLLVGALMELAVKLEAIAS